MLPVIQYLFSGLRLIIFAQIVVTAEIYSMELRADTQPYEEILVHDDYINIAGVQIMSVEYALIVLADYSDRPLHVRGHLCATSDSLYRLLRYIFRTNGNKPLISTWGHEDHARCEPPAVPWLPDRP